MKIRILFSVIVLTLISSAALHAASEWWYNTSGVGNWDYTTTGNWYYGNDPFQAGDGAHFEYLAATVTIDPAGVAANHVFFSTVNTTITGGTLSFVGSDTAFLVDPSATAVISSYVLNNTGGLMIQYTAGGTLQLGGGGNFGSGGFEQQKANTLWLTAGTYTTSGGFNANNWAGSAIPTLKFSIGSGVANGGASLNVDGQLGGTTYGGLGINSINLDFATSGTLSGNYVVMSYGSLVGTAFANVSDLPAGYTLDYNYNNANEIALVQPAPEPATWALLLGGLGMVTMFRRRA